MKQVLTRGLQKTQIETIKVNADSRSLDTIKKIINRSMKKSGFSAYITAILAVSVVEHCENIIRHAYAGKGGEMELKLEMKYPVAGITILDRGPEFNMKKYSIPDISTRLKKGIGGKMGIRIIFSTCDSVEYKRKDGYNENTFIVREKISSK